MVSENKHTVIVWPDADMPQGHDFVLIEHLGETICVLAESKTGCPRTLADAWAAYRMVARPRWVRQLTA